MLTRLAAGWQIGTLPGNTQHVIKSPRVIVAARVLAGYTQIELARAAGIATSVLQAIEQGRSNPKLTTINAIVDTLRTRGVELFGETDRVAWGVVVIKGSEAARD